MFEICSDLSKTGLKIYSFCQHSKKAKKWPNGRTILFLANSFKKGQSGQIWPLKRSNGNPDLHHTLFYHALLSIAFQIPAKLISRVNISIDWY